MVGGRCFLCAPFSMSAVFSLWLHLSPAARAGGGPGACSMPALAAWLGSPVHPSRCAQRGLGVGALGGDEGSILLKDSMQALFGGPFAWGVAARLWLWGVESCLQPLRQAHPFPTPRLHHGLGADWGWAHLVVASCCFGGPIGKFSDDIWERPQCRPQIVNLIVRTPTKGFRMYRERFWHYVCGTIQHGCERQREYVSFVLRWHRRARGGYSLLRDSLGSIGDRRGKSAALLETWTT